MSVRYSLRVDSRAFFLLLPSLALFFFTVISSSAFSADQWRIGVKHTGLLSNAPGEVVSMAPYRGGAVKAEGEKLRSLPFYLPEGAPAVGYYEEKVYSEQGLALLKKSEAFTAFDLETRAQDWPGSEVRTLVEQGPTQNRINLTIVGDGYTEGEKEKFFADAQRITKDLFDGDTFHSYLPLFNVFAVFVPSQESGITDRTRKNTALGLYRDPAGSKRAIMPGNTRAAERAIALSPATDYPILLANDDFYGGLGGRYAITTRSETSGTIVLRHELGHNFGEVGEEYDGGYVYSGANHSGSTRVPWAHWANGPVKTNESVLLFQSYPWHELADGPFRQDFSVPAGDWTFGVLLSSVGWDTADDVEVKLGDQKVEIVGKYHSDRSFFLPKIPLALPAGDHTLEIHEKIKDGNNVVATVQANAFPIDYDFTPEVVGAYATYDSWGDKVGYRPTHQSCLMREMQLTHFCAADQENMWIRFLSRVQLIDEVLVEKQTSGAAHITAKTPNLPGLSLKWFTVDASGRETERTDLEGQHEWDAPSTLRGRVKLKVQLTTSEVRLDVPQLRGEKQIQL